MFKEADLYTGGAIQPQQSADAGQWTGGDWFSDVMQRVKQVTQAGLEYRLAKAQIDQYETMNTVPHEQQPNARPMDPGVMYASGGGVPGGGVPWGMLAVLAAGAGLVYAATR